MTPARIGKLNAVTDTWQRKGISTSELVEAMALTCDNCDAACVNTAHFEYCCICVKQEHVCELCENRNEAKYQHVTSGVAQ